MLKLFDFKNLIPTTQKSYYNKAKVCSFVGKIGLNKRESKIIALYSYDTLIACIDVTTRRYKMYLTANYNYSATTRKHLHDFLKKFFIDMSSKELKEHAKQQGKYLSVLQDNNLPTCTHFNDYTCTYY
jgi:hypothetical protein